MKTIAVRLAASVILVLGGATVAWPQGATKFTGFGCVLDLSLINGIPQPFAHLAPATTYTEKQCPSPDQPMVIVDCFATLENWPDVSIDETEFTCLINGSQCGFSGSREATKQRLQIDREGNAELQCSVTF
jgi:hypothetical protein